MSRLNGARRQFAVDGDSETKFGTRLATDISSSLANFGDDRVTRDRTACSESCIFGVGGRMSRADGDILPRSLVKEAYPIPTGKKTFLGITDEIQIAFGSYPKIHTLCGRSPTGRAVRRPDRFDGTEA